MRYVILLSVVSIAVAGCASTSGVYNSAGYAVPQSPPTYYRNNRDLGDFHRGSVNSN